MNDVIRTIYQRRAVRKFKNMPIVNELIEQLIAAGRMAPSAMNRQPWKFYVVKDKELIASLSEDIAHVALKEIKHAGLKELAKMTLSTFHLSKMIELLTTSDHVFYSGPVVVFITTPARDEWGALDVGMCAQNIMLAAKAVGLDSCPVGFARFVTQAKDFYRLNIPDEEVVQIAIVLGFGDEQPTAHERLESNIIYVQ